LWLEGAVKFQEPHKAPTRNGFDTHKHVFEAVAVTVQYQMDNGSPIFAV
jgi:hypothetical protein